MKSTFICIKKGRIIAVILCIIVIFSHIVLYLNVDNYKNIINNFNKKIFNSFNKDETDGEDGNIFFVSNNFDKFLGKNKPSLKLPSDEEYVLENGTFTFSLSKNFVVKSAGEGIVKEVGFLSNGLKYIDIRHSGNITTRYENLKIIGVGANFLVKNIHVIGTANNNFIFKILKDNKILESFSVENGEILWQE